MSRFESAQVVVMVVLVATMGVTLAPSPASGAQVIFGTIGNHFVIVDPATASVEEIGATPDFANLEGLTFDPATGALYGVDDGTTDPKLIRIDRDTGAATEIGPIDLVDPFVDIHLAEALAFNPANGKLYAAVSEVAVPSASYRLAVVNPATGWATEVGPFTGVAEADAMAFIGGTLYVSDTQPPRTFLYAVDPATAAGRLVGEVGFNHVADLAYDDTTAKLYGTAHTERLLITISTQTGEGTVVGTTHTSQDFGGATLTAIAFAPAPTSFPCDITVAQGQSLYTVRPVESGTGVTTFYDYYSVSAHTPYVEPFASVLFLYYDETLSQLYFVFHFNIDAGGSPDAITDVGLGGIPAGATVILSDDPNEFRLTRYPQGQFHYWVNTDGGVLGPLPTTTNWAMTADISHSGPEPMLTQKWVDGDGTRLALDMAGRITISSVCNEPPEPHAGGPYTGVEGSPITFDASGSSDPDGDPLTYTWDFEDDGTNDVTTTDPITTHTYPDDFAGFARLTVSDGTESAATLASVSVANAPPTLSLVSVSSPKDEGGPITFEFLVSDPGTDTVTVVADWGDGTPPEPLESVYDPKEFTIEKSNTYGDDGAFDLRVTATDDDGGVASLGGGVVVVDNLPPTIVTLALPFEADEGAPVSLRATAVDPGSDDLTFEVDFGNGDVQSATAFNDGVGPDPDPSPLGTWPFSAEREFTTRYEDDGQYLIEFLVRDDDGGVAFASTRVITVRNVAPTILPFGPVPGVEGAAGSATATATDPGNDDLTFTWEFEFRPTFVETRPATGSPTTATSTAAFLYGDDGSYLLRLTVTDDDGASTTFETAVEVSNEVPEAHVVKLSRPAAFTLRVAGEKWHDVTATFYEDGTEIASLYVFRVPGSPNEQAASTDVFDLAFDSTFTARVVYTPEDDPVNGQPNGASPAWLLIGPPGEEPVRIHHTFNVQHEETYVWDVDLTPALARLGIVFEATATDPGSDDLTFAWDFGDGGIATATVFNDGAGPDPARSPDGTFPFTATDTARHAFAGPGTHTITLTVTDDDGGATQTSITITIPG